MKHENFLHLMVLPSTIYSVLLKWGNNKIINQRKDSRNKQINKLKEDAHNQEFLDSIMEVEEESSMKPSVIGSIMVTPIRLNTTLKEFQSINKTPQESLIKSPILTLSKTVIRRGKTLNKNKLSVG